MEIGILGSGVVGRALAAGYARHGHGVRIGTRQAQVEGVPSAPPAEVVRGADLVVIAVNGHVAVDLVLSVATELEGKVLVDATNPLEPSESRLYFTNRACDHVWRLPAQMKDDFARPEIAF